MSSENLHLSPIRTLIIDDEMLAREELKDLLVPYTEFECIAEANNAIEGLKKINQLKPDVIFLDIHMPQISGIDLLGMLDPETMPFVVFATAYDQYAIQAFEDNAFDYLLKPIDPSRFEKTLCRLRKHHRQNIQRHDDHKKVQDLSSITPEYLEQIPCIGLNRIVIIPIADTECIFTDISGVHVRTAQQTATSQLTLKVLEQKTPLLRCHRQYLVNLKAIKEIKLLENGIAEIVTTSDQLIPVSRRYLKTLKEHLGLY